MKRTDLAFPVGMLFLMGLAQAETEVCGTFSLATEWTAKGSPYLVTGDIFIPATSRLRINPGVTVRFDKQKPCPSDKHPQPLEDWSDSVYTGIKAEGTFYCLGTEEQPVVFESASTTGSVVGWDGIRLSGQNAHSSEISFGIFRGANQAIKAERAGFFIHHCLFKENNTGVMLGFRGDVNIVNCNFIGNLNAGIVIRKAAPRIVSRESRSPRNGFTLFPSRRQSGWRSRRITRPAWWMWRRDRSPRRPD